MNSRNSTSRRKNEITATQAQKTRKKREELSVSASKSIKQENIELIENYVNSYNKIDDEILTEKDKYILF